MKETKQQARLRLFLQEYEGVCKRYSLVVFSYEYVQVLERFIAGHDHLPGIMEELKENGINT